MKYKKRHLELTCWSLYALCSSSLLAVEAEQHPLYLEQVFRDPELQQQEASPPLLQLDSPLRAFELYVPQFEDVRTESFSGLLLKEETEMTKKEAHPPLPPPPKEYQPPISSPIAPSSFVLAPPNTPTHVPQQPAGEALEEIRSCALHAKVQERKVVDASSNLSGDETHSINFNDVPIAEFIRFVSKISKVNFIFDNRELQFKVTLASGKSVTSKNVLKALLQILRVHGFSVKAEDHYFVIHKVDEKMVPVGSLELGGNMEPHPIAVASSGEEKLELADLLREDRGAVEFMVYKLQYHQGSEIQEAVKKIAADLSGQPQVSQKLLHSIHALQWVQATNSLLCSGDSETLVSLRKLLDTLDTPLRQVFIEVLVVETDVKKNSEFGLQWAVGGQYGDHVGFGTGNFAPHATGSPFAKTLQGIGPENGPTGLRQIPLGNGFDAGVIGDIIMHRGKSFLTLGSLVSALQAEGDSTIVLNQKIITQDNKNSTIFVGDNIPFTGSVVQTVGQSQQTTANIEYRDIGVSLSITPRLGEGDIITLDLSEEISEEVSSLSAPENTAVNGIRATKTNMATQVHVPDKHFLVLSGMIRNAKSKHKAGLPCLGGLPYIGAAFSKTRRLDEKRNVIIFVRPHIVQSMEDYKRLTQNQEELYRRQSAPGAFDEALYTLPSE